LNTGVRLLGLADKEYTEKQKHFLEVNNLLGRMNQEATSLLSRIFIIVSLLLFHKIAFVFDPWH